MPDACELRDRSFLPISRADGASMKSPASFSRGAGWPQRPSKLAYPASHSTSEFDHLTRFVGLSTHSRTAITGTLCGVERLGRVDVADGVLVSINTMWLTTTTDGQLSIEPSVQKPLLRVKNRDAPLYGIF